MTTLQTYDGPVEGVLHPSPDEILRELMGVIEAALEKSIRLTKSGIPPKPLWAAINERLLWQDSRTILYDWDEVDQVRLIYSLAVQLALVQPDDERQLGVGPGAEEFFLATPTRRGEMLLRAYLDVVDWDERCDARNDLGHRHNFGQTFRRDFQKSPYELRRTLVDALALCPEDGWVQASALALRVTHAAPDLLISEDDEAPVTPPDEADPEVERLVEYWVILAARFGWLDLARTPAGFESRGKRLLRLTRLGRVITGRGSADYAAEEAKRDAVRPFVIQPNNDVVFYRRDGDISDEYLLRRVAVDQVYQHWDVPVVTYHVTPESLRRALESGSDPDVVDRRILGRTRTDLPPTFRNLLRDARRQLGKITLTQGLSAVELGKVSDEARAAIRAAGFSIYGRIVVVPWRRWGEFTLALGEEVTEGFRYPSEEPLASFEGTALEFEWPVLPMVARDLIQELKPSGDPPVVDLSAAAVAGLARAGWTPKAVAEAVSGLCDGKLPPWLASEAK